jgi:hypothetical protein
MYELESKKQKTWADLAVYVIPFPRDSTISISPSGVCEAVIMVEWMDEAYRLLATVHRYC